MPPTPAPDAAPRDPAADPATEPAAEPPAGADPAAGADGRRGPDPDPDPDPVRAWAAAHGTEDPGATPAGRLVRGWLRLVGVVVRPLVRAGIGPDAVTLAGLVVSAAAVPPALAGGRWALLAAVMLGLGGLVDGLDGAVARASGRSTRWGAVLDAACDRVADAAGLVVLWLLGAPAALVLVAAGAGALTEYVRARAQGEGLLGPGAVTVSERPTRVAVAAMFALACAVHPASARLWSGGGAAVAAVLGAVSLVHLLRVVRRELRA